MLEGADLIVQRASARGTAMASSPSRKRPDGRDKNRDWAAVRKQCEAVYCQVSRGLGEAAQASKSPRR